MSLELDKCKNYKLCLEQKHQELQVLSKKIFVTLIYRKRTQYHYFYQKISRNHDLKMLKTIQLPLCIKLLSNPRVGSLARWDENFKYDKHFRKTCRNWKFPKIFCAMFGVLKHIAQNGHKKLLYLAKALYQLLHTSILDWFNNKTEIWQKNCNNFGPKTPKNDLLTLNYGLTTN